MANTIDDFQLGDEVYHASNADLKMIVAEIYAESKEIFVRWLNKAGNDKSAEFEPFELRKWSDRPSGAGGVYIG